MSSDEYYLNILLIISPDFTKDLFKLPEKTQKLSHSNNIFKERVAYNEHIITVDDSGECLEEVRMEHIVFVHSISYGFFKSFLILVHPLVTDKEDVVWLFQKLLK